MSFFLSEVTLWLVPWGISEHFFYHSWTFLDSLVFFAQVFWPGYFCQPLLPLLSSSILSYSVRFLFCHSHSISKNVGLALGISSFRLYSFLFWDSNCQMSNCILRATHGNLVSALWLLALSWFGKAYKLSIWLPSLFFLCQLLSYKAGLYSVMGSPIHPTDYVFLFSSHLSDSLLHTNKLNLFYIHLFMVAGTPMWIKTRVPAYNTDLL